MEEDDRMKPCEVVVIGGSAGSLDVLMKVLPALKPTISFSIVIVLHRKHSADATLYELLVLKSALPVREIEDKESILPGYVYLVPADYHLLFERKKVFSLDDSEKINYSRPSIDVTFESGAEVYGEKMVAVLLSGSNNDGSSGMHRVMEEGGVTIVQKPETASSPFMPQQALLHSKIDYQFDAEELITYLNQL